MTHTLSISDSIYGWLQEEAKMRGLSTVEELLETWKAEGRELRRRREVVEEIKALQEEMSAKYGEMPDSVDLIREDRDR
jgi:hypothetical protein